METVTLADGQQFKLGRIRPTATYDYGRFRAVHLPDGRVKYAARLGVHYDKAADSAPPPDQVDWTTKAMDSIKRVYLNDQYGDCVIASKYHVEGSASAAESGTPVLGTDQEVLSAYHGICGPGDNGCVITDVLDAWRDKGLTFNGVTKKIAGYAAVDHTNKNLVQVCIEVFGNLTLGIDLPSGWTCTNCIWGPSGGMVGGHDVPSLGYGASLKDATGKTFGQDGVLIATWGGLCLIPWAQFLSKQFITEAYVCLPLDWTANGNVGPNGISAADLAADLQLVVNGQVPPLPGPGPTPVPPGPTPVPPGPTPATVSIPALPVTFLGAHVPGLFTAPATIPMGHGARAGVAFTIPPWVVPVLRIACAGAVALPSPWNFILGIVCGLLPAKAEEMGSNQSVTIVVPPWLPPILTFLCAEVPMLPDGEVKSIAALLCSIFVPQAKAKAPCGCH